VLRNQLLAAGPERPVVQLVPVSAGAGSTTTAAHLAVVLAEQLPRVAVVDLDLRRPALHAVFGVSGTLGVTDVIAGDDLAVAALPVGASLDVLAAGAVPPDPSVFLTAAHLGRLVGQLRERYDAVVLDTPSVAAAGDALLVAPLADLTVVVVTAGRARTRELRAIVDRFEHHGVRVDAIVLNQARRPRRRVGGGAGADPADSVLAAVTPRTP
jgi:capsular exopolysaccharide synthesis family protein